MSPKAVVLLSGGLDSATTLAIAQNAGFKCHALSFDYGQRHAIELAAAVEVAQAADVARHIIVKINLRDVGGSALTDDTIDVPKSATAEGIDGVNIPVTYVPARNTIFLSFALAYAEKIQARDIFIGVNALDYSGYPDCRPEYILAYERMANLATKDAVAGHHLKIHAPLINDDKATIITTGSGLGVDYGLTWSCYEPQPDGRPCGHCDSCLLRAKGFADANLTDPLLEATP